jgi:outer membrane protein OmpA-like peptidoglycan-associated protein
MNSKLLGLVLGATLLFGCASPKKAELQSADTREAFTEVQNMQQKLVDSNIDVLAKKDYEKGTDDLLKAGEKMRADGAQEDVLSRLAQAKAHYLDAKKEAKSRETVPTRVLVARQSAIKAGAYNTMKSELKYVDKSLISKTDKFSEELSVDEFSEFQNQYLKLEGGAVQTLILAPYKTIIKEAKKDDADDLAPKTYKTAREDVQVAENQIRHSPRDPAQYSEAVDKANKSAKLLSDTMKMLKGEAKGSSEAVALKLVYQERKLGKLSSKVETLEGSLGESQTALGAASKDLLDKNAKIMSAESKVRLQNAMNEVRESFNEDEAAVYQQGMKLIIRLKKINFASGDSKIPNGSMDLLSKVSKIVTDVKPEEVVVEGHSDSMGKDDYNLTLSDKRAAAVKEYFASKDVKYKINARGYGEAKPIANNETSGGRALNRRVDIVVKVSR